MSLDPSQQIILNYKDWLDSFIKPRAVKSDPPVPTAQPQNKKLIILDNYDE